MADREVVGGEINAATVDEAVQVRLVGIVDDLLVAVVLHHDKKHVVEMRDSPGVFLLREAGELRAHRREDPGLLRS